MIGLYGSNGHSASSELLWSDLFILDVVQQVIGKDLSLLDHYPNIKKVYTIVEAHPQVSAYLKNRKNSPF